MLTYNLPGITVNASRYSNKDLFGAQRLADWNLKGSAPFSPLPKYTINTGADYTLPAVDVEGVGHSTGRFTGDATEDSGMGPAAYRNLGYITAALSGFQQYKAAGQYDAMANQADTNAYLARQQSADAGWAGAKAANDTREKGQRMIARQAASYGASGVDSNVGSAADVQAGTAGRTERDAQTILYNTALKRWGLENEANQYDAQAQNYRNQASAQRRNSLLNTALQVAQIYFGVGG